MRVEREESQSHPSWEFRRNEADLRSSKEIDGRNLNLSLPGAADIRYNWRETLNQIVRRTIAQGMMGLRHCSGYGDVVAAPIGRRTLDVSRKAYRFGDSATAERKESAQVEMALLQMLALQDLSAVASSLPPEDPTYVDPHRCCSSLACRAPSAPCPVVSRRGLYLWDVCRSRSTPSGYRQRTSL